MSGVGGGRTRSLSFSRAALKGAKSLRNLLGLSSHEQVISDLLAQINSLGANETGLTGRDRERSVGAPAIDISPENAVKLVEVKKKLSTALIQYIQDCKEKSNDINLKLLASVPKDVSDSVARFYEKRDRSQELMANDLVRAISLEKDTYGNVIKNPWISDLEKVIICHNKLFSGSMLTINSPETNKLFSDILREYLIISKEPEAPRGFTAASYTVNMETHYETKQAKKIYDQIFTHLKNEYLVALNRNPPVPDAALKEIELKILTELDKLEKYIGRCQILWQAAEQLDSKAGTQIYSNILSRTLGLPSQQQIIFISDNIENLRANIAMWHGNDGPSSSSTPPSPARPSGP